MKKFLKVLAKNIVQGPSTDPFPLGETFTPEKFRGKVVVDTDLCMGCGACRFVCTAGAIHIEQRTKVSGDGAPAGGALGYDFTVWHNSCCLCASCRHVCPTKAITLSNDWHNAHEQSQKFTWNEQKFMPYTPCETCGAPMRLLPLEIAEKLYAHNTDVDAAHIVRICPQCRQQEDAARNEARHAL